jgi:nucleoside-diphosphate-sugar epimerase
MKAFLTGATGFLGGYLVDNLLGQGIRVSALVRPTSHAARLEHAGVDVIRGHLTDPNTLEKAMQDADVVYHLAALTTRTAPSKRACYEANVVGTDQVARAVLKLGIRRMVFCSTAAVYGVIDDPPVDEQSRTRGDSPYAETKVAAEQHLLSAYQRFGLPVVIVRFPGVLGYGSPSFVGLFRAIAAGRFRVIGPGNNHTHIIHVTDIVQGLRLCAETPGIEGRTYNLASEQPVTVNELVTGIAEELEVSLSSTRLPRFPYQLFHWANCWLYRACRQELPRASQYELFLSDKVMSIAKARQELGFAPKVSLNVGLRDAITWHRERGEL